MGRPDVLRLERSVERMTVGTHQAAKRRHRLLQDGHTGEFIQQLQIDLSGVAGNTWDFADQDVFFEFPFLYAPLQRRVEFDTPHFTRGMELTSSTADMLSMVLLDAKVVGWQRSEENWITGATVRFEVCAPNTLAGVPYTAIAHLAFQGYASYPEGDEFTP